MPTQLTDANNWKKVRLDQCFALQQGKQVSKKNRIGDNQRPFLRTANVFWGRLDLTELDKMHFTPQEELKFALRKGDLLVCEGGDIGRTAIWNDEIERCYYQNHLHRLRKLDDSIDEQFAQFYLQYAFKYAKLFAGRANVTTIPNLSQSRLGELEMPLPKLNEQISISKILSTIQNAISSQEKLLDKQFELKRNLMQHLFTYGTKSEKTKLTEIGEMPESWDIIELGKICDLFNGYAFKSSDYIEISKTVNIRMSNIRPGGHFDLEYSLKYLPDNYLEKYQQFQLKDGDLIIAMTDMANDPKILGIPTLVKKPNGINMLLNQRVGKLSIVSDGKIQVSFLRYYLTQSSIQDYFKGLAKKGVQVNIGKSDILSVRVKLPSISEQKRISEILNLIDTKIVLVQNKYELYQELFKTLLNELMSGKRRVKN